LAEALIQAIKVDLAQIDLLLTTYTSLIDRVQQQSPDVVELAALATVLHSYYNGIESIFLAVARLIDGQAPQGTRWHRELLAQVARPTTTRPAVLSSSLETRLTVYLAFRHYVRHSYAFTLDWARLEPLVRQLRPVHAMFHEETYRSLIFLTDGFLMRSAT
jgi:hypothetical protein